ncbi:hypothetical protein [Ralstonia phage RSP15]|uniref:hypothetical protein n=1 Tax=Ralstonia phage RSP15 TaxID=1785960 RepID=UPI00074D4BCF|nr:hypothetical protein BH754_gp221 [Ralstonia phage RSP15]BAU40085.1 hypothetical protein [Ralstonia phage RSP15]
MQLDYVNLNEVFDPDSAYPFEEVADKGLYQTYTFDDGNNNKYQLMFTNIATLGKRVQTIRLGQQVPGGKYYKPVLRKITNPFAMIATILKIFQYHTLENSKGKLKGGFAFGIPDTAFGAYSGVVKKIIFRMLRAKWDGFDSQYRPNDDQYTKDLQFVYLASKAKGTKANIFNGPEGPAMLADAPQDAQPAQPAIQTPVVAPNSNDPQVVSTNPTNAPKVADTAPKVEPKGEGPEFYKALGNATDANARDGVLKEYGVSNPNISALFDWLFDVASHAQNRAPAITPSIADKGILRLVSSNPRLLAKALNYYVFGDKTYMNGQTMKALRDAKIDDHLSAMASLDSDSLGRAYVTKVESAIQNGFSVVVLKRVHQSPNFMSLEQIANETVSYLQLASYVIGHKDALQLWGKLVEGMVSNVKVNRDTWKCLFFLSFLSGLMHGGTTPNKDTLAINKANIEFFDKVSSAYGDSVRFEGNVFTFFSENKATPDVKKWEADAKGVTPNVTATVVTKAQATNIPDNVLKVLIDGTIRDQVIAKLQPYEEALKNADWEKLYDWFAKNVQIYGTDYNLDSYSALYKLVYNLKKDLPSTVIKAVIMLGVRAFNADPTHDLLLRIFGGADDEARAFNAKYFEPKEIDEFLYKAFVRGVDYYIGKNYASSVSTNAVRRIADDLGVDLGDLKVQFISKYLNDHPGASSDFMSMSALFVELPLEYDEKYPDNITEAILKIIPLQEFRKKINTVLFFTRFTIKTVGKSSVLYAVAIYGSGGTNAYGAGYSLPQVYGIALSSNLDDTEFVTDTFNALVDKASGPSEAQSNVHAMIASASGANYSSNIFGEKNTFDRFMKVREAIKSDGELVGKIKATYKDAWGHVPKEVTLLALATGDNEYIDKKINEKNDEGKKNIFSVMNLDSMGYLETNLARFEELGIDVHNTAQMQCWMLANSQQLYGWSKKTKYGRELVAKISDSLSELYDRNTDEVETVYAGLDEDTKKSVALSVAKTAFLRESISNITGDDVPIKPYEKLTAARLKTMLKYNEIEAPTPPTTIGAKASKTLANVVDFAKTKAANVDIPGLNVRQETKSDTDLEDMSYEYDAFNNYRHGGIAVKFLRSFDVNFEGAERRQEEFLKSRPDNQEVIQPAFHGTGSVAASMILRKGFTVIKSSDPSVVGRMLGDGVYFSNVIDKVAQYVSDGGYQRGIGTKGYIFEMSVAIGKKYQDYRSAGLGNDSIRSPEWAVYHWNDQIVIKKAYEVQLIKKSDMEALKKKVEARKGITANESALKIEQFPSVLREASGDSKMDGATTYIFMDGQIPISKFEKVDFENFDPKQFGDHVRIEPGASGPMVIIDSPETECYCVRWTSDFMVNTPEIEKFVSLLKGQ